MAEGACQRGSRTSHRPQALRQQLAQALLPRECCTTTDGREDAKEACADLGLFSTACNFMSLLLASCSVKFDPSTLPIFLVEGSQQHFLGLWGKSRKP